MAHLSRTLGRLQALFEAARRIADPEDELGQRARALLPSVTGLSIQGVELALNHSLEHRATRSDLRTLANNATKVSRAHVLLSSNVFVAALRAIAIAVASSEKVEVRASRREPVMSSLLSEGAGGVFELVSALAPVPGDHLWAFGASRTLASLREELPGGVILHGHGPGFGAAVIQQRAQQEPSTEILAGLAQDVALFDQRGCLSPRIVVLVGEASWAHDWVQAIAAELAAVQHSVPRGTLTPDEAADITRFRDSASFAMDTLAAGKGWLSFDDSGQLLHVPPTGRCLHVMRTSDALRVPTQLRGKLTSIGLEPYDNLERHFATAFPGVRLARIGQMQKPPLDGPVDQRGAASGELL